MTPPPPQDPATAAVQIGHFLEKAGISYAIGGAIAYGLWGVPRATIDVDLNIFVEEPSLPAVVEALQALGVQLDLGVAEAEAGQRGMFTGRFGQIRVDVFMPSIEFCWEAERTRVRHRLLDREIWFLSAEALAVFKLLFFRAKDLVDLERLVAVQGDALDAAYIRGHLVQMMGEEDERVSKWDALVG